jgi:glucose dehydrogenase
VPYGNVYFVTLDDKLVALDATNGRLKWQVSVASPAVGYSETVTPLVYNATVIIESAGGNGRSAGSSRYTTRRADGSAGAGGRPEELRRQLLTKRRRDGWTTPALDPQRNLLIFSTGNPKPDLYGNTRRGDNPWSDSIVALDVRSGKLRWAYQEVKHDVWDYDAVSPVVLFDVVENAQTIPAASEAGTVGWFFIVNRETGKLIRKSDPYVAFSKNAFTTPTKAGVDMLPGANGGANWSPPAYSQQTHYVYEMGIDQLMKFTTAPQKTVRGQLRLGSAFTNVEPHGVQDGRFVAIDTYTGKIAWTHMTRQPLIGGPLVTASNLAFMGEGDGNFDALYARTGRLLWQYNLAAGVNAPR